MRGIKHRTRKARIFPNDNSAFAVLVEIDESWLSAELPYLSRHILATTNPQIRKFPYIRLRNPWKGLTGGCPAAN